MSHKDGPFTNIYRLYWSLGTSSLVSILEAVRTTAVGMSTHLTGAGRIADGDTVPIGSYARFADLPGKPPQRGDSHRELGPS
jgi:hypothetical protein